MIPRRGLAAIGVLACAAIAPSDDPASKIGQTYTITLDRRMEETISDGSSSGSSMDVDTITERVVAVRSDGVEAEFDLPSSATPQDRAAVWQLPARVLLPVSGVPRLLNEDALAARVDAWLRKANLTRVQCGKGVFTWNDFTIECDPQSALRMVARFHPPIGEVREGAAYHAPTASGSTPLRARRSADGSLVLTAALPIDIAAVRRERAEAAVTVAKLSGEALTPEAALQEQAMQQISGTIATTFEFERTGALKQRTTVTRVVTTEPTGVAATQTVTEVLTRRCTMGCS